MVFSHYLFGQTKKATNDTLRSRSKDTLSSKDIHPQDSPESSRLILESKDKKLSVRFYGSAKV